MNKNKRILLGGLVLLLLMGGGFVVQKHMKVAKVAAPLSDILYYYCPMHPNIQRDHPGSCPICSMDLVPKKREVGASSSKVSGSSVERKVKYWVDSMNPKFRSDKPGKAPDGMDLVPVYEEETSTATGLPEALKGLAPIYLTEYKQQLIGVKQVTVAKRTIMRTISTVGRRSDTGGGWVADIYSLDIDFVKVGQKAWVTALNGVGLKTEGVVAGLFPYDDTQSRVRRVRINTKGRLASPYGNVVIESTVPARLAVPVEAVMDTGIHTYVFVQAEPGHFVPREVTVGFKGDAFWEVVDGLKADESVVSGANFLVDADSRLSAILKD
jgi:hypothetical protein